MLDIGSGWGGLSLYLAEMTGANVTGVTLRPNNCRFQRARRGKNLTRSAKFLLQDYRDVTGPFDRIVSVGMFEHVGVDFYETFFRRCAELLTDDGVMMLHSIGRSEGPDVTNPWIAKYIFPGGYIPALSEVMPAIERAGLLVCDIEILRLHYAETLKAWRERFMARREEAVQLYDERFARMWEFYLACSEMSFRKQNLMNFQIQLTKRQGVVPMTRDYIFARRSEAARHRARPAAATADRGRIEPCGRLVRLEFRRLRAERGSVPATSRYDGAGLRAGMGELFHGRDQVDSHRPSHVRAPSDRRPLRMRLRIASMSKATSRRTDLVPNAMPRNSADVTAHISPGCPS